MPGKYNIGTRRRTIRLSTGAVLIALSVIPGLTALAQLFWPARLVLVLPIYIGLLAALEGSMSLCPPPGQGDHDFYEPMWFASKRSKTLKRVGLEGWKRLDRRKALRMHVEAVVGAVLLAVLLPLA